MKTFIIVAETAFIAFLFGAAWELNRLRADEELAKTVLYKPTNETPA